MSGSIYMAATGALAYERRLQVLSNNLANVNTVGFKKDNGRFQAFSLSETTPNNELTLLGNRSHAPAYWMQYSTYTDFSSGEMKKTGSPFDLAITGRGFFCVQAPDGVRYTRRGDFTVDKDEVLVTQEGYPVLGQGGEIQIKMAKPSEDKREFSVSEDGFVTVDGSQVDRLHPGLHRHRRARRRDGAPDVSRPRRAQARRGGLRVLARVQRRRQADRARGDGLPRQAAQGTRARLRRPRRQPDGHARRWRGVRQARAVRAVRPRRRPRGPGRARPVRARADDQ